MIRSQHENRKPFAPNSLKIPTRQHRCNKATLSQKKPQLIEEVAAQQRIRREPPFRSPEEAVSSVAKWLRCKSRKARARPTMRREAERRPTTPREPRWRRFADCRQLHMGLGQIADDVGRGLIALA
jgi:hypothetical protein